MVCNRFNMISTPYSNFVCIGSNRANVTMQQIVNDVDEVKCMQFPVLLPSWRLNLHHRESDTTGRS